MDEVAACRRAAHDAVRDIEPDRLRAVMDDLLAEASLLPGVVTLRAARAAEAAESGGAIVVETDGDAAVRGVEGNGTAPSVADHVAERAAGVQLIYEGLRLIRELASEDPWGPSAEDRPDESLIEENLAVLAADVLVSRGFYLLARTSAADKAVETVRNFGRDQTLARGAGGEDPDHDRNLEADVLQLALVAGAAGSPGVEPTADALAAVADLARTTDSLPPAESGLAGVSVGLASGASFEVDGEGARTPTDS